MEFLLFLCAALTALTGAITSGRTPGIEVQIERVSSGVRTPASRAVRAVAAIVRAQRLPALTTVLAVSGDRSFVLAAISPLFGTRRRE